MKPQFLIALATAIGGFALGWSLKPSDARTADLSTTDESPPERLRPNNSSLIAPGKLGKGKLSARVAQANRSGGRQKPELIAMQDRLSHDYVAKRELRNRAKLNRLSEAVGLSEEQEDAIAELMSQRAKRANPFASGTEGVSASIAKASSAAENFEANVAALLDPDQKARLAEFKARERENRIEAGAQRDLSKVMSNIDLSTQQREAALALYRGRSTQYEDNNPPGWDLVVDPAQASGADAEALAELGELIRNPDFQDDPQSLQRAIADQKQEQIEEEVEMLEEVLTPAQLEELRAAYIAHYTTLRQAAPPSNRDPRFLRSE